MSIIVSMFGDSVTQLTEVFWYLEVVFLTSDKFRRHPVGKKRTFEIRKYGQSLNRME
jgi:hypothetical protein